MNRLYIFVFIDHDKYIYHPSKQNTSSFCTSSFSSYLPLEIKSIFRFLVERNLACWIINFKNFNQQNHFLTLSVISKTL